MQNTISDILRGNVSENDREILLNFVQPEIENLVMPSISQKSNDELIQLAMKSVPEIINKTDPVKSFDSQHALSNDVRAQLWITLLFSTEFTQSPICMLVSAYMIYLNVNYESALCISASPRDKDYAEALTRVREQAYTLFIQSGLAKYENERNKTAQGACNRIQSIFMPSLAAEERIPDKTFNRNVCKQWATRWSCDGQYLILDSVLMLRGLGIAGQNCLLQYTPRDKNLLLKDLPLFCHKEASKYALSAIHRSNAEDCLWPECSYFFMHVALEKAQGKHAIVAKVLPMQESCEVRIFDHQSNNGKHWKDGMRMEEFFQFYARRYDNLRVGSFVQIPFRLYDVEDSANKFKTPDIQTEVNYLSDVLKLESKWHKPCNAGYLRGLSKKLFEFSGSRDSLDYKLLRYEFLMRRAVNHRFSLKVDPNEHEKSFNVFLEKYWKARARNVYAFSVTGVKVENLESTSNKKFTDSLAEKVNSVSEGKFSNKHLNLAFYKGNHLTKTVGFCCVSFEDIGQISGVTMNEIVMNNLELQEKSSKIATLCTLVKKVYTKYLTNVIRTSDCILWVQFPRPLDLDFVKKYFREKKDYFLFFPTFLWNCVDLALQNEDYDDEGKKKFKNNIETFFEEGERSTDYVLTQLLDKNLKFVEQILQVLENLVFFLYENIDNFEEDDMFAQLSKALEIIVDDLRCQPNISEDRIKQIENIPNIKKRMDEKFESEIRMLVEGVSYDDTSDDFNISEEDLSQNRTKSWMTLPGWVAKTFPAAQTTKQEFTDLRGVAVKPTQENSPEHGDGADHVLQLDLSDLILSQDDNSAENPKANKYDSGNARAAVAKRNSKQNQYDSSNARAQVETSAPRTLAGLLEKANKKQLRARAFAVAAKETKAQIHRREAKNKAEQEKFQNDTKKKIGQIAEGSRLFRPLSKSARGEGYKTKPFEFYYNDDE